MKFIAAFLLILFYLGAKYVTGVKFDDFQFIVIWGIIFILINK